MNKFIKLFYITVAILLLSAGVAMADTTVTIEHDTNNEPDLAGYRVYQTATPGDYYISGTTLDPSKMIKVQLLSDTEFDHEGDRCRYSFTAGDGTHYWVVTAIDSSGNESAVSNEVTKTLDSTAPGAPSNVLIVVTVVVSVQ